MSVHPVRAELDGRPWDLNSKIWSEADSNDTPQILASEKCGRLLIISLNYGVLVHRIDACQKLARIELASNWIRLAHTDLVSILLFLLPSFSHIDSTLRIDKQVSHSFRTYLPSDLPSDTAFAPKTEEPTASCCATNTQHYDLGGPIKELADFLLTTSFLLRKEGDKPSYIGVSHNYRLLQLYLWRSA